MTKLFLDFAAILLLVVLWIAVKGGLRACVNIYKLFKHGPYDDGSGHNL